MKHKKKITIGLIQASTGSNFELNLKKTVSKIRSASKRGAKIICLQELFGSPYFPQVKLRANFKWADRHYSETIKRMLAEVAKNERVVLIAPFFEKSGKKFYNSAFVIDADGTVLGRYRKMHIPDDPGFYEKYYFRDGDLGFKVFKTKYAKIGVLICWDQWFPEAARTIALKGADIIFYPTAIGWDLRRKDHEQRQEKDAWQAIQRSHAIVNGVFVASVNRVGREKNLKFWGSSFVADPFGKIIAQAGQTNEQILTASCNLSQIQASRKAWPFLRDLRPNDYR